MKFIVESNLVKVIRGVLNEKAFFILKPVHIKNAKICNL